MSIPDKFKVTAQDAYNYAASKYFADQQLCMVLKFTGELDEAAFAKAVRLTLDLEPVLGCRLVENGDSPFWERRSDLNTAELCKIVDNGSPQESLENFVNEHIHANVDPLVTARIVKEKDGPVLCIKMNHSACDAGGLKEYVAILSNVYTALVNGKQYAAQPNLGKRDQSQIFQNKEQRSPAMKGFPTPTWTLPQKAGSEPLHSFTVIPRTQLEAIKKYAHNRNATVNDVLLTALYRTLFAINNTSEGNPMIMQVSIDLRRYCPNGKAEAICNLSGALYVALSRRQDELFEGTLARVCTAMSKHKENNPGLESAAGLEYLSGQGFVGLEKYMAQSAEMGRRYNVSFPLLSNFGVLDNYRFGDLQTNKGYITSPIMYPPGFMLGVSTCNGEMTLSVGYCGQENTKQVKAFKEGFHAQLAK